MFLSPERFPERQVQAMNCNLFSLQMVVGAFVTAMAAYWTATEGIENCHVDPANYKLGLGMYCSYFCLFAMLFNSLYLSGFDPTFEGPLRLIRMSCLYFVGRRARGATPWCTVGLRGAPDPFAPCSCLYESASKACQTHSHFLCFDHQPYVYCLDDWHRRT